MNHRYIGGLLSILLTLTACEENRPDFFDEDANGVYFDYKNSGDFKYELNFGDYIVGTPQEVDVPVKVKLLGYLTEEKRSVSIKTKSVENYETPEITIPEVFFVNNEYEKDIEISIKRPEVKDKEYAVCLYFGDDADLISGITGKDEFIIYVKESYKQMDVWQGIVSYLGNWSEEKHKFLANLTGDNKYYEKLWNKTTQQSDFDVATKYNELVFNELFKEESTAPITVDFPILSARENPNYNEPYFWKNYSEYIGDFSINLLHRVNLEIKNVNTSNIITLYAENIEKIKKLGITLNKERFRTMLNEYYTYPELGYPIAEYKEHFWEHIDYNTDYSGYLRIPYWWDTPDSLGKETVAGKIGKFFGKYSDEKYQFMIKTMIREDGEENFITESMFPFSINIEDGSLNWDNSIGGEERLKECYRKIKERYEDRKDGLNFEIPDVIFE